MAFSVRAALLYASIFLTIGVQTPFLPLWLAAKGLDPQTIGVALAAATAARVTMAPVGGRLTDQFGSLQTAVLLAFIATGAGFTLTGFADRVGGIMLALVVAAGLAASSLPLVDAYAVHGLAARGRPYGPVRLWGSVAFIVGNLAAGWISTLVLPVNFIWVIIGCYWLGIAPAVRLPPVTPAAADPHRRTRLAELWRVPGLLPVMLGSGLIQASHALFYGFGSLQWTAAGLSGLTVGLLWALSVVAEIMLFAFAHRAPDALTPMTLLMAGAIGGIVRWAAMALDPAFVWLPVLQVLHALSFGATHLGAMQVVARSAPPGLAATTQAALSTINGAFMAAALALSGLLYASAGPAAYAAMAALAAAGGGVMWMFGRRGLATEQG